MMGSQWLAHYRTRSADGSERRFPTVTQFILSVGLVAMFGSLWAGVAWAGPPLKRCFDKAFTTEGEVIDPVNNYFDQVKIWFDATTQRQRLDLQFNNPNETPLRVNIYLFPQAGVSYRIIFLENETQCTMAPYAIPLEPLCFEADAPVLGSSVIAGKRLTDIRAEGPGTIDDYRVLEEVASATHCVNLAPGEKCRRAVPVTIHSRSRDSPTLLANMLLYFNYRKGVDPAAFDLPANCPPLP